MGIMTIAAAFLMRNTAFGRSLYAVGGNGEAAEAAGIPYKRTIVTVFGIHGLIAGVAAILFATQLQVIQSTVPNGLELVIITASVVGGVSILGASAPWWDRRWRPSSSPRSARR